MSAIQAVAAMRTMPGANGQSARAMPQDSISEFHGSMPGTSADATSAVRTTMEERLFQSSANFKILTSMVAMHLPVEWREKMFQQIDTLLDAEQWESDDAPPTVSLRARSCGLFLRSTHQFALALVLRMTAI